MNGLLFLTVFTGIIIEISRIVRQIKFGRLIKNSHEKAFVPYKRVSGKFRLRMSAAWIIIEILDLSITAEKISRAKEYLETDLSYHMRTEIAESLSRYSLHRICCVFVLVFYVAVLLNELFWLKKKPLVCILPDGVYYEYHHLEPVGIRYAVNGGRVILLNDKDRKIAEGEYTADCEKMLTAYYPSISDIPMSQI